MKKFAYIALTMMLVLAACTKVETYPEAESRISFAVGSYVRQTKAGESSFLGEFANAADAQFKSKAYMHGVGVPGTQDFFGTNGETITWNATAAEWGPSHDYYWPKSSESYIDFVSWYDKNSVAPTLGYNYDKGLASATMSWTDRTIGADDNILFADVAWRQNGNLSTYHIDGANVVGVPTLFHHALARVRFMFKAASGSLQDGNTEWTIAISNFQLHDVYTIGTLALTNDDPGSPGTTAWDGSWVVSSDDSQPVSLSGTAISSLNYDAQSAFSRSVLPQALGTMKISFDYTIRTTYANGNYVEEVVSASLNLSDFTASFDKWEWNKNMTYTITIDPRTQKIVFDPAVTEWIGMGSTPVNII